MRSRLAVRVLAIGCFALAFLAATAKADFLGMGIDGLIRIDERTGQGVTIAQPWGYGVGRMAMSPWGTVYFVGQNPLSEEPYLGTINPVSAAVSQGPALSGSIWWASHVSALEFSRDGTLFAIDGHGVLNDTLDTIDLDTGLCTAVGGTGLKGATGLAFSADGTLYGWDTGASGAAGLGLVTIEPLTGVATDVNPAVGETDFIWALAFAPDGTLYGAYSDLFTVDLATGELTLVGPIDVPPPHEYSNTHSLVWIPEPSTLAGLFTMGGALLLAHLCRRRRRLD